MAKNNIFTRAKRKQADLLFKANRLHEAKEAYSRICQIDKGDAESWFMLGVINGNLKNADEAMACFGKAIELRSDYALAHYNIGNLLYVQGKPEEAVKAFREAVRLDPQYAVAHGNLGYALLTLGRDDEALSCFREQARLNPENAEALTNLGNLLQRDGHLGEAVTCYRKALRLNPASAKTHDNLGNALCKQGMYMEAVAHQRQAVQLNPGDAKAYSNLLLTLHYLPEQNPGINFSEHKRWAAVYARPMAVSPTYTNSRDPERRLRVGYVSSDFRTHSVSYFFEPLLADRARSMVETICYSAAAHPDATTERLRRQAGQWRDISSITDERAADMIRSDKVDILVDLAGHTAGSRVAIFAHKPAPVQVTYLGYPDTTGIAAIDYRLADDLTDPVGQDVFYTEKLIRLAGCFLCYQPHVECPVVAPLPALEKGYVTFGSFNNLAKINPKVVALWAELLQDVQGARLLIKNSSLTDPGTREHYHALFEQHGISRERIEFLGRIPTQAEHLALYGRMDIALDTFPYNGTTTTCEALWMGVPVVTLVGRTHAGRVGLSLLTSFGSKEWIAESPRQYISLASNLADDVQKLAALRAGLRQRMTDSPLCDGQSFARKVEAAYREMWRTWCAS